MSFISGASSGDVAVLIARGSVRLATAAALAASTYANGTLGVGATLTADANGVMADVDGVTPANGDRLLVKDQASGLQNGIYTVTSVGVAAVSPAILTRYIGDDVAAEIEGSSVFVEAGTANAGTLWACTNTSTPTIGTTALTYTKIGGTLTTIAGGGTGQITQTAAFDALAPTTTQGDLVYHNGTDNVRLAKGTGLQGLRMNAGATAPEWAVSGGALTLLETISADGTLGTYTTTADLSGYNSLRIQVMGRSTKAAITNELLEIRFNADAGANYDSENVYDYSNTSSTAHFEIIAGTAAGAGYLCAANAAANNAGAVEIIIPEYAGTTFYKNFIGSWGAQYTTATGDIVSGDFFGQWRSTAAITSITFKLAAGNFVNASKIRIYGVL